MPLESHARAGGPGVTQVRGISTTRGWEHRRPRRPLIELADHKRRATAYPTVSERTREVPPGSVRLDARRKRLYWHTVSGRGDSAPFGCDEARCPSPVAGIRGVQPRRSRPVGALDACLHRNSSAIQRGQVERCKTSLEIPGLFPLHCRLTSGVSRRFEISRSARLLRGMQMRPASPGRGPHRVLAAVWTRSTGVGDRAADDSAILGDTP